MEQYFSYSFFLSFILTASGFFISLLFFISPRKIFLRLLKYTFLLAVPIYTASIILRTLIARHAPMIGLFESLFFFGWSLYLMLLVVWLRFKTYFFLPFSFPILFFLSIKAVYSSRKVSPLFPALKTLWFEIHVVTSFLAYGLFAVGFAGGACYLLKNIPRYSALLPESDKIDLVTYRASVWGFFLFSFSMFAGGIWAYLAWCNYFIWTPKEIWSVLLWMFYAFYLHARLLREWSGKKCACLAILGFIVTIFTYLGVSLLMRSSHTL